MTDTGSEFAGETASHYSAYRRDVPDVLIEAAVCAADLTGHDVALDLGCGTGQVAIPLSRHVRSVLAADPEPDMLMGLRARLVAMKVGNVLPVLAADHDLAVIATVCGDSFGVVTVANALHWMDADHVFMQSRRLLRGGGALIIISQGPPVWLSSSAWSRELRAFLERWTGGAVSATCGTDQASLEQRALGLRRSGYPQIEVVEHAYENEVDLTYIAGHLRSAMSESALPLARQPEFLAGLNDALRPQLEAGPLIERIEATALIAIADATPRSTSACLPPP
ncbi:MAG: class I SAM-dependent methyltransferase [Solirubrobacteraceae bacterium]